MRGAARDRLDPEVTAAVARRETRGAGDPTVTFTAPETSAHVAALNGPLGESEVALEADGAEAGAPDSPEASPKRWAIRLLG